MRLTLQDVARATGGRLHGAPDTVLTGVSTDSRTAPSGCLFVAIPGERFDGHAFLDQALGRGATAALISRADCVKLVPASVLVEDTVQALGALARFARGRFAGPVIAITGSAGKTTTKELCAEILVRAGLRVRRTLGSLNNHIGLPLTILSLEENDDVLVVELGMNHHGEIAALTQIASPHVGAITLVAAAHIGHFGSLEEIGRAKGELLDHLRPEGCAVLNADDPIVTAQAPRFAGRRVWFGTGPRAEYRAERCSERRYRITTPHGACEIELALPGVHLMLDGLCAAAAAAETGLLRDRALEAIRGALEGFRGLPGRLLLRDGPDGVRVLDDSYNANPGSVRASVGTLQELVGERRGFVLLGDMGELGEQERALHAQVGRAIAEAGSHALFGVGPLSVHAVTAAREAGIALAETAPDPESAARSALALARSGDVVLVKGSRSARMERAVAVLVANAATPTPAERAR